jgi:hypothetical protein
MKIHPFNKHVLEIYYIPGTIFGTNELGVGRIKSLHLESSESVFYYFF